MADVRKFKFVSPGIFLNEIDRSQVPALAGPVGPVIIGRTERGPGMRPVVVNSFSEFVEIFGNPIAGGESTDVWRNGSYSAPTYASFAAQAYLRNNSPATIVRLVGHQHGKASTTTAQNAGMAGWGGSLDVATTSAKGAYGLWVMASSSHSDEPGADLQFNQTASLAAVWYMTGDAAIALTGSMMKSVSGILQQTASHSAVVGTSSANSNGEFTVLIGTAAEITNNSGTGAKRFVFNFNRDSENYIRNVFNTNPEKTNSTITATVEKYWLGETYERSILDGGRTGITTHNSISHGVILGYASDNTQGADNQRNAEPARTGWFVAQDTGTATSFNPYNLQKLFRLVGLDASGEWLGKNLKVSIQDIKPPTSLDPAVPQYGTFTVGLRKIDDFDTSPNFVEMFTNCDLNPNSANFIARKIGDKYMEWDDSKKYHRGYGKYENMSRFIRVELHPDVENGEGVGLLPFGFHAPPKLRDDDENVVDGDFDADTLIKTNLENFLTNSRNAKATATITVDDAGNVLANATISVTTTAGDTVTITGHASTNAMSDTTGESLLGTFSAGDTVAGGSANNITQAGHIATVLSLHDDLTATNSDTAVVTITQDTAGANTTSITVASTSGSPNLTVTAFAGGSKAPLSADYPVVTGREGDTAYALTASYKFPRPVVRYAWNQSGSNYLKPQQAYWGIDVAQTGSVKYDPGTPDLLRPMPATLVTYAVGSDDTGTRVDPSHIFTLDNIIVPLSNSDNFSEVRYISGSRATGDRKSVTAMSGAYFLLTGSDYGFNKFTTVFHGGFDGLDITEADPFRNTRLDDAGPTETGNYAFYSVKRAIDTVRDPERVTANLMALPGITNQTLTEHLISTCEERADALAIIDLEHDYIPAHDTSAAENAATRRPNVDNAVSVLKNRKINSSYGACYYPSVQVRDTLSNKILAMPPSVVALGAMSYSEAVRELWFAPAGFTRGGLSAGTAGLTVLGVKHHLTSEERDKLYDVNVNPVASFPAEGVVIFGQKTLQATPSALDRINVRRLLIHIKREVSRIAATTLFEQNVLATWDGFSSKVTSFLNDVKARVGLTDFKVVLDETTTTPDLVDRNIMYAKIFLKPAQAIEFIALDFIITDSGASFAD